MPNLFGQPFISLLSPVKLPTVFHGKKKFISLKMQFVSFWLDYQNKGSLFTLFLTSPAFAFCFVCHLNELKIEQWNFCQENVNKIIFDITKLFFKSKLVGKIVFFSFICKSKFWFSLIDNTIYHFIGGDFLRLFLARFVFCYAVLRLHRAFKVIEIDDI
jgi:hypothetical protein